MIDHVQIKATLENRIGDKDALKHLARLSGFIEVPPTIEEFIEDPYFAGEFLGNGKLYGIWKNYLKQIFPHPLYSPYLEIAITGSIGGGKSTACLAGMLYDLCRLLYLRDPHLTFGQVASSPLVVAFVNATMSLSESVLVNQFKTMMESSQFFRDQMAIAKSKDRKALLPHKINIMTGSRGNHALGKGVISAILSELNFQGESKKDQAVQNFVQIQRRMKSRFERGEGLLTPGRLWLDSSRKDETGFLEQYMQEAVGRETTLKISHAIWEIKKSAGTMDYSGEIFKVFIGQENRDPQIIQTSPGGAYGFPEELIIEVPIEHYEDFYSDIYGALRDFAGLQTWSGHKFLPQESLVRESLNLVNPCGKEIIELNSSDQEDTLMRYVIQRDLPRDKPFFVHFDTASGKAGRDRIGVALTRAVGEISVERAGKKLANVLSRDIIYETNLAFAVIAKAGQEVSLARLRNFVIDLCGVGFDIGGVSADGFQSAQLLQELRESGLKAEVISTDRTREAYDVLKDTLLERRWKGPALPLLTKELLALQDLGKKIDHPVDAGLTKDRPSKDISDAVAASLLNCKMNSAGGKAIGAFEQFADQLEKAKKQSSIRETLKEIGLKKKYDSRRGMGRSGYYQR